jgi:hypothetical protein
MNVFNGLGIVCPKPFMGYSFLTRYILLNKLKKIGTNLDWAIWSTWTRMDMSPLPP